MTTQTATELHWFRTAYDRAAHTTAGPRRFTCGTPTGYGLLIRAYPLSMRDSDASLLPAYACRKCVRASQKGM